MIDSPKRLATLVLLLGIVVLVGAIAIGEREGDRVIGGVTEKRLSSVAPVTVTPEPGSEPTTAPYGPNWKRTDVMAAAPDPGFPDPRVPPAPLPTPLPPPKYTPPPPSTPRPVPTASPSPTPTPNLNLPVWRRTAPLPGLNPRATAAPTSPTPTASTSPQP